MISYVQFNHHTQPPTCSNKTTGSMWPIREAWEVSWKEIPASPTTRATCALSRPNDKRLQLQIGLRPWGHVVQKALRWKQIQEVSQLVSTCFNRFNLSQQIQLVPGFFPTFLVRPMFLCSAGLPRHLRDAPCVRSWSTHLWNPVAIRSILVPTTGGSWLHMGFRPQV